MLRLREAETGRMTKTVQGGSSGKSGEEVPRECELVEGHDRATSDAIAFPPPLSPQCRGEGAGHTQAGAVQGDANAEGVGAEGGSGA